MLPNHRASPECGVNVAGRLPIALEARRNDVAGLQTWLDAMHASNNPAIRLALCLAPWTPQQNDGARATQHAIPRLRGGA